MTALSIDGWSLARTDPGAWPDPAAIDLAAEWLDAVVPGTVGASLRALGRWRPDDAVGFDAFDFWFRATLTGEGPAILRFDGLATIAEVYLDGAPVLASDNMFLAHELALMLAGHHVVHVAFRSLDAYVAGKKGRARWRPRLVRPPALRFARTLLLGHIPGWGPPVARRRAVARRVARRGQRATHRRAPARSALRPGRRGAARRHGAARAAGRGLGHGALRPHRFRARRRRRWDPARLGRDPAGEALVAAHARRAGLVPGAGVRRRANLRSRRGGLPHHSGRPRRRRQGLRPHRQRRAFVLPGRLLDQRRHRRPALLARGLPAAAHARPRRRHEHDPRRRHDGLRGRRVLCALR